jgi:hypothetical protein
MILGLGKVSGGLVRLNFELGDVLVGRLAAVPAWQATLQRSSALPYCSTQQ